MKNIQICDNCFEAMTIGVPRWDDKTKRVIRLEHELHRCKDADCSCEFLQKLTKTFAVNERKEHEKYEHHMYPDEY